MPSAYHLNKHSKLKETKHSENLSKSGRIWQCIINHSFTDQVQNVPRRAIFLNSYRWYRVTLLPIIRRLCLLSENSVGRYNARQDVTEKLLEVPEAVTNSDIYGSKTRTLQLWREVEEHGVEGALFVHQLTEKQTGNVASVHNGCARATVSRQFK
jgi:hypothetical protein